MRTSAIFSAAAGARRAGIAKGLGAVAAFVMALNLAAACGAIAAPAGTSATKVDAAGIAGRWSGSYHSYGAVRAKCDGGPCKLTIDIAPCPQGWCGVLVKSDGACGGLAMTVAVGEDGRNFIQFQGNLVLDPKAAAYTIQATLRTYESGEAGLNIIGDTGTEMMFMRRSFPFQAHLARAGDSVCTPEKATS